MIFCNLTNVLIIYRLPTDPSSNRYIMDFSCGDPFVKEDLEFVTLKVKGVYGFRVGVCQ